MVRTVTECCSTFLCIDQRFVLTEDSSESPSDMYRQMRGLIRHPPSVLFVNYPRSVVLSYLADRCHRRLHDGNRLSGRLPLGFSDFPTYSTLPTTTIDEEGGREGAV